MDNKIVQNIYNKKICNYKKIFSSNNLSLKISNWHIKNKYYLVIEIKPSNYSTAEAIKMKKFSLQIIKFNGTNIPETKIYHYLDKSLNKYQKGKTSNNFFKKLYLRLRFQKIYKKYFHFDETIIVLVILFILFVFGVIWSSYFNMITDYMLTK